MARRRPEYPSTLVRIGRKNGTKKLAMNASLFQPVVVLFAIAVSAVAGDLRGRVVLTGTPPPETKIDLSKFPELAAKYPSGLMTRRYQIGSDGGLQNVLVSIRGDFQGRMFEPPKSAAVFDHQDGVFAPYMMGIRTGQPLELRYPSGVVLRADAKINKGFAFISRETHVFAKPEVGVRLKCECHLWAFAYLGVFDHPFYAVTDHDGNYRIVGVPTGRYTLNAYHPKAGTFSTEVTVAEGELRVPDVTVKPR